MGGIKHAIIEVSDDILLQRCIERENAEFEKAGTTREEVWAADYMAEYRQRYGEEYSEERYTQMMRDGAKEQSFVKLGEGDKDIPTLQNDDWKNNVAVKQLNKLVGLEWEDLDTDKIAAVNMARMKNLNLNMDTPTEEMTVENIDLTPKSA